MRNFHEVTYQTLYKPFFTCSDTVTLRWPSHFCLIQLAPAQEKPRKATGRKTFANPLWFVATSGAFSDVWTEFLGFPHFWDPFNLSLKVSIRTPTVNTHRHLTFEKYHVGNATKNLFKKTSNLLTKCHLCNNCCDSKTDAMPPVCLNVPVCLKTLRTKKSLES